jgi:hypothetical protein
MRERNMGWRLDYVLAHEALPAISCSGHREFGTSDHGPVQAQLDIAPPKYEPAPEPPPEAPQPPEPGQIPLL